METIAKMKRPTIQTRLLIFVGLLCLATLLVETHHSVNVNVNVLRANSNQQVADLNLTLNLNCLGELDRQHKSKAAKAAKAAKAVGRKSNDETTTIAGLHLQEEDLPASSTGNSNSNSNSDDTWYGNSWIPPFHIPRYTREDMMRIFQDHDTLFIGDSTTRRAYATMFAMFNATNPTNIPLQDLDANRILNIKKDDRKHKYSKSNNNNNNNKSEVCNRGTQYAGKNDVCRTLPVSSDTSSKGAAPFPNLKLKLFDYVRADCFKNAYEFATDHDRAFSKRANYSMIIFGLGLHDVIRFSFCFMNQTKHVHYARRPYAQLELTLQAIEKHLANPADHRTIVWRTHGYHVANGKDSLIRLNEKAREYLRRDPSNTTTIITTGNNNTNGIVLVDWGKAIYPRSHGPERNLGDTGAHYGLEGRLLFAQMLTHELLSREKSS